MENVLAELGEKPTTEVERVSLKRGGRERPLIVKLQSRETYCGLYLARDISFAERIERTELHKTMKELRNSKPGTRPPVLGYLGDAQSPHYLTTHSFVNKTVR